MSNSKNQELWARIGKAFLVVGIGVAVILGGRGLFLAIEESGYERAMRVNEVSTREQGWEVEGLRKNLAAAEKTIAVAQKTVADGETAKKKAEAVVAQGTAEHLALAEVLVALSKGYESSTVVVFNKEVVVVGNKYRFGFVYDSTTGKVVDVKLQAIDGTPVAQVDKPEAAEATPKKLGVHTTL